VEAGPKAWTGTLVCDVAMGGWPGPVPAPITLKAKNGRVESVSCDHEDLLQRVEQTLAVDDWARHVGEFAFGINDHARVHEEFIETEKLKTVHLAIGHNLDYPGVARNASRTHLDFLVEDPTVTVTYADGATKRVMDAGKYVV
jgi:leucyl aminopeptidase (aminopeptidase T)